MEAKAPGGKLARLKKGGNSRFVLSGDFFIYPEEGIVILENALSGLDGDESLEAIESVLFRAVMENDIELVGLDISVIAMLYKGVNHVESPGP